MYTIYKLTSPSNKSYIGYTSKSIEERFIGHATDYSDRLITKAIKKYGKESFNKEILETLSTLDETKDREIYWISFYDTNNRYIGYNMTKGGDGVDSENASILRSTYYESEEGKQWKKELSNKWKEDNPCKKGNVPWNKGIPHSLEIKHKMSDSHRKRYQDPLQREKQSEIIRKNWENGAYDNRPPLSEEAKKKIGLAQLGKKQTDYQKQRAREANLGKIMSEETKKKIVLNNGSLDKIICEHCGKEGQKRIMKRWHGDNCRNK